MAEPGWYPNPDGTGGLRLYDGLRWTAEVTGASPTWRPRSATGPERPPAASLDRRPTNGWRWDAAAVLTVGSGSAAAIGSLMSWAHRGTVNVPGMRSDGTITLLLGVVLVGVGAYLARRGRGPREALVIWVLVAQVCAIDIVDATSVLRTGAHAHFSIGPGLYVLAAAAGAGCVAALLAAR